MTVALSLAEARRVAIAATGLAAPRLKRVTQQQVDRTIRRLGLVQLDFVTSVVPAHYQVLFSRLGHYDRKLLDHAAYRSGSFTEQWAHEASIIPVESWPLLRYRRESHLARPWSGQAFLRKNPQYAKQVVELIRKRGGAVCSNDLPDPPNGQRRSAGTWYGSVPRIVLEAHFGSGTLAVTGRRQDFARFYDLAERVIDSGHFNRRVDTEEAYRQLLLQAARALGVATEADLADYFRMYIRDAKPRIHELRESGELLPVAVEGWRESAHLHRDASDPGEVDTRSLLSPFDPLIWFRKRVSRLFGFDYRFEIFIPEPKRKWGSYVLPFLSGDRLIARVDLKTDRAGNVLRVQGAYVERDVDRQRAATELVGELKQWAEWLGLGGVTVAMKGDLAKPLARAVRAQK